jgi:opacity protein-like surface antigen
MKSPLFAFALLASSVLSPALAADMPAKAPVSPVIVLPSSGLFFGVNAIGAQLNNKFEGFSELQLPGTGNLKPSGGMAGFTVGWHSAGPTLIGVEADFDYDFTKNNITCVAIANCQMKSGLFATQRVVLGAPLSSLSGAVPSLVRGSNNFVVPTTAWAGQLVPYVTGGVAERRLKACVDFEGSSDCGSKWLVGWVVGGGIKLPVATHVSLDLSYLYVGWNKSFSIAPSVLPATSNFKALDEQILKLGLNRQF